MILLLVSDWVATLSFIFGGCCSNAITLELLTSEYPHAGSLITFFQFLVISIHGLPKHVAWTRHGPRFKPRRIPLTPYVIQVALFYCISLLNNAAFAYRIPMAVHIIFRSGGLIITMILGCIVVGKRYTPTQILSVLIVTLGVAFTTLSASGNATQSHATVTTAKTNLYTYATGIAILILALLLSGFLGLVQDWTNAKYGRPVRLAPRGSLISSAKSNPASNGSSEDPKQTEKIMNLSMDDSQAWRESMFYLHLLALPMFLSIRKDLAAQFSILNAGPHFSLLIPLPAPLRSISPLFKSSNISISPSGMMDIHIPKTYLSLLMNTLTQLLCVAGVHRLTMRVSALSVTLVLVVRKAVSLVLSVVGLGGRSGREWENGSQDIDIRMMWTGAVMVLLGSIAYSVATSAKAENKEQTKDKRV